MIALFFLFIFICLFTSCSCLNYCEASSLIHTEKSGFMSYPIELFNYHGKPKHKSHDLYICNASFVNNPKFHCTSTTAECPIDSSNLDAMSQKTKTWNYQHSLCHLAENDQKNKKRRLIIFGGSFTAGRSSYGCFCLKNLGNECPAIDPSLLVEDDFTDSDCRWGDHVGRWFNNFYPNSEYYVLSSGGVTSSVMLEQFENRLFEVNITSLNSNDIVLLDHSVNDATSFRGNSQGEIFIDLSIGLEGFIQKLYKFNDGSDLPTLVLLEFWAYNDAVIISKDPLKKYTPKYNYSDIYVNVAKAYNLTLWSYRDVVWSKSVGRYDDYTLDTLRFLNNANQRHPPWIVHLYYADLVVGMIKREIDQCSLNSKEHTLSLLPMLQPNFLSPYSVNSKMHCIAGSKPLELYSYSFLPNAVNHAHVVGSFYVVPNSSFPVYEDSRKKSGWIDVIDINNKKHAKNYSASLFFQFMNKKNLISTKAWILKVFYFRSYNRVGVFDLYLCNNYVATVDGLWDSPTSETKIYKLRIDPSLNVSTYCYDKNPGLIEIRHKYIDDKYKNVRENQKVKIVSIEICESDM